MSFPAPVIAPPSAQRVRLLIHGLVQGVGFRPFVYGLAQEMSLSGWIRNDGAGVVIEVAYANYRGGEDAGQTGGEANFVRILHDDGSFAVYAHLERSSVRVRTGQRVERGEYIASSGNTGYSTGPHLHFAVQRNTGLATQSMPVRFEIPGGGSAAPKRGEKLVNP